MTRHVLVPPLLLFQLGQPYAPVAPDPGVLVVAERAFARDAAEHGSRAAFLAHMGEGSVVFEPAPVDARATWEARPEGPGRLSWAPAHAEIAASADLGFTTGPWEFRPDPESDPVAFGEYATVWRKDAAGSWKFAADIGISHGPHAGEPGVPVLASAGPVPDLTATPADVLRAERAFVRAAIGDVERAYREHAAPDVLLLREGSPRAEGRKAAIRLAARHPRRWEPWEALLSEAGDLGVVYGIARPAEGADPAGYLRVWRRRPGEGWRIALDVATSPPPGGP